MKKALQKIREVLEGIVELLSPSAQPGLVAIPVRVREQQPRR
jgi:hypothetical protein